MAKQANPATKCECSRCGMVTHSIPDKLHRNCGNMTRKGKSRHERIVRIRSGGGHERIVFNSFGKPCQRPIPDSAMGASFSPGPGPSKNAGTWRRI